MVCFNVFLYCLLVLYILPLPGLLGSGWLGCLPLSGSPDLHTLINYATTVSIVYLLQVVYAYSVYPSLCHCHTTAEPYLATGDL